MKVILHTGYLISSFKCQKFMKKVTNYRIGVRLSPLDLSKGSILGLNKKFFGISPIDGAIITQDIKRYKKCWYYSTVNLYQLKMYYIIKCKWTRVVQFQKTFCLSMTLILISPLLVKYWTISSFCYK